MTLGAESLGWGLAAVWLVIAAVLSVRAARMSRGAVRLVEHAKDVSALLAASPAKLLLAKPDGTIEADPVLLQSLGVRSSASTLEDLHGELCGLEEADLARLRQSVRMASLSGQPLALTVRLAGGSRSMEVLGGPAPAPSPPGSVLLWLSDTSRAETEKDALERRLADMEGALDALTRLIEAAPFPMWYRGPDLSLGLVNEAFVRAVEARDAGDVITRQAELIDASGTDSAKAGARRALESDGPFVRAQPATIGGERRMMKVVDVPLATGAVAGFAVDVQDLEDARFELSQYIDSQRELADRLTAGTAQFDADRRLAFYNQPFAIMAQLEPEWLADKPEFDRLLERMRENHRLPEVRDFPHWKAERRDWFTSAEEVHEEEWILANGDHLRVVGQPLPDGGLRLIFEDRTEQVRLASARDTLLRVRTATFDNLFEGLSVFASDGRLYLWNRRFCDFWGLDESWLGEHPRVDELVPAMARRLVNPTAAAQLRELVRAATAERRQGAGRISMVDGRHFEFAAVPLPDGNALFTMVDVTDSTRIEAALRERTTALEEADRVRTDFVANMSYELRTPLTSIGGFAEMLGEGYAGPLTPAAKEYVAAILEAVGRLSKLISDVLDLTQGEQKGVTLDYERVDVGGLARSVAERMEPAANEKRLKFQVAIGASAGVVQGDPRRIRESLEHVLRNALAYTDKGRVTMAVTGDEERARIEVADTGPGVSDEEQRHVFERFYRSGAAKADAALGLGLPLTRQFIEAHGGTVELQSAKGKGTVVTITIPRNKPA